MTKSARKSLIKRFVIAMVVALLGIVLAMQFVYAPTVTSKSKGALSGASADYDSMNGVKITYKDAEGSIDNEYLLSDTGVKSDGSNMPTPAPSKEVDVIVSLNGTPMMNFAFDNGMTVSEALATDKGKNNLKNLQSVQSLALGEISEYIIEKRYEYTTVMNAFSATVKYGDIAAIEKSKYVKNVMLSDTYLAPEAVTTNYVNVYETGIFNSEGVGYDGSGTVVAVVDTGTDYTHEVFDMELTGTLAITKDDVAAVAPSLTATSLSSDKGYAIDEDDLYLSTKLPYAYDYADSDTNVYPRNSHGTHVAGIIAGKSDVITGVATGAQIATFKVFSDYNSGAKSEWIMAALNDAVTLGVDAINMSLGTSCGFTREVDEVLVNEVYDSINAAGICLVVAASNDASSAQNSTWGNTNLATNPDSGTVGSPGSYTAALSVGSVSGVKTKYFIAEGHEVYFAESRLIGKTDPNDFVAGLLGDKTEGEFEYVVIPGIGLSVDYQNRDVTGKIAVVKRGNTNFEEKVRVAASRGAIGVIVYNNVSGTITMSVGTKERIPSCFVTMDLAEPMVAAGSGKIHLSTSYLAGPFMSDFSSWGALPNLTLAPDITAHGGEIYSAIAGKDKYDRMSGTSMACPNLAGALIVVRQAVKEKNPDHATTQIRDESYSRMMSTATIVKNEEGNPYSPRKQGAGIADISHSVNTKAYLTVDGSNKPKLSIGDDPTRSGVYTLKFNLINTSGTVVSYNLDQFVMTESMSSDDRTVAEKAHLFEDTVNTYSVNARKGTANITNGNTVAIGGYGEAEITVTIALSSDDKAYLDRYFVNGMFVEGYVLLDSNNSDGIDLNIPYLAFYGDWAQAPMLDVSAYEVGASAVDDSVLEEDKLKPDVYGTLPYSGFYSASAADHIAYYGMGEFAYLPARGYESPVPQEKYAALTTNPNGDYILYMINAGLLRCAKRVEMSIRNSVTGELLWTGVDYNARKSHASGVQVGGTVMIELDIRDLNLPNNAKYIFDMTCYLDWTGDSSYITATGEPDLSEFVLGNKNTFSFEFTIDNEAPELSNVAVRKSETNGIDNYYLDLSVYDNHYIQGYAVYTYESKSYTYDKYNIRRVQYNELTSLTNGVVPVDGEFNADTLCSWNISGDWDLITKKNEGNLYVVLYDYAKNMTEIELTIDDSLKKDDLKISKVRDAVNDDNTDREYYVQPNGQLDLKDYINITANISGDVDEEDKVYLEGYWMKDLIWESSDGNIIDVTNEGVITGMKAGDAVIRVRTPNTDSFDIEDKDHCLQFTVHVTGEALPEVRLSGIELSTTAISLERGESAVITATLKPYNYTGSVNLVWSSTSSNVTYRVRDDGMSVEIFAAESGSATIRANAQGSYTSGYCAVTVKQEFTVHDNSYLRSYTGRGGDWVNERGEVEHNVVEIPDDLGVVYIYPGAFSGNKYIRKVIIPDGISTIMRGAFLNCSNLEEVVLPKSVEEIDTITFANCENLKKINLENVKTIGDSAFWNCTSLTEINLENCTYIDKYAFHYNTGLKSLNLGRVGVIGGGAFFLCTGLETLTIPENTSMEYDTTYLTDNASIDRGAAFGYCFGLKHVTIKSKNVGLHAFRACTGLESVVFENDVETISALAFNSCISLKSVTFYGSLYKIDTAAFSFCEALESFTFPKGTTILGTQIFYGSDNIETINVSSGAKLEDIGYNSLGGVLVEAYNVEDGNKYLSSEDGVLYDRAKRVLLAFPGKKTVDDYRFTVPASVRTIGKSAFAYVSTIQYINLGNVEYIEEGAFTNFRRRVFDDKGEATSFYYTEYSSYDKVKYIGDYAFENAAFIQLPIGNNVTYIGDGAFRNAMYVELDGSPVYNTSFVFPRGLKYLGDYAFGGTSVTYDRDTGLVDADGNPVTVPAVLYITAPFRSVSFAGCSLTKVGVGVFSNCAYLTSVNFGNLTAISDKMFESCRLLRSVVIPSTIKLIGTEAFKDSALASVNLSNSVIKEVPYGAFRGTALTTVQLPDSVQTVGDYAFAHCTQLRSVNLNNVTKIGNYAFTSTALVAVVSNNEKATSVNTIGNGAFRNCENLVTVNMPYVDAIGNRAFENCTALSNLNIDSVKTVGDNAFRGDTSLETVVIDKATDIGANAFSGAEKITSIDLQSVVKIGDEAFAGTAITTVTLPATLNELADKAFYGISGLTSITVAEANAKYKSIDGVLYSVNDKNFYTLVSYPAGKTATSYDVYYRTIKLGAYSFNANTYLEDVSLPVYLQVIGSSAMSGMTSLENLTIYAADAPSLESNARITYLTGDPTPDDNTPGDETTDPGDEVNPVRPPEDGDDPDRPFELEDDFRDRIEFVNYYDNFSFENANDGGVGEKLKIHIPVNSYGYNNRIWTSYVGKCIDSLGTIHIQLGTLEYIDSIVAALDNPNISDQEVNNLVRIYNMLSTAQQCFVTGNYNYSDITGAIDKDYYDEMLGGVNFYAQLLELQSGARAASASAYNVNGGNGSSSATNGIYLICAVAAFTLLAAIIVLAVSGAKRRNRK